MSPLSERARIYSVKPEAYFGEGRRDYIDALSFDKSRRILELGCGNGSTGALALDSGKCGEYVGIEIFPPMAKIAADRLTKVLVGNVEEMALGFDEAYFDVVIMSEVLEHLVNPDEVLTKILSTLKPGGLVMASSPNIATWKIIKNLLVGKFDYENEGPMDKTHLRWFTPKSFRKMFENAGVIVEYVGPVAPLRPKQKAFKWITGGRLEHLHFTQINLLGKRA